MSEAVEQRHALTAIAGELDDLCSRLAQVQRDLEPVEREYEQFVANFELGLWRKAESGEIKRLPGEALRLKMAHLEMPAELLGRREGLRQSEKRLIKRISTLKAAADARRSVLSALKVEMEATQ